MQHTIRVCKASGQDTIQGTIQGSIKGTLQAC